MSQGYAGTVIPRENGFPGRIARGQAHPSRGGQLAWRRVVWSDAETGELLDVELLSTSAFFEALGAAGCESAPAEDRDAVSAEPIP